MAGKEKDQEKPGVAARVAEHLAERLNPKTVVKEMVDGITDKVIPQGAAELGQAIFGQGAYVPYGTGQEPIQPLTGEPEHGVHGKQEEDKQQEAAQEPKQPGWMKRLAAVREQQKEAPKEEEFSM